MGRRCVYLIGLLVALWGGNAFAQENYKFVTEYVREISAFSALQNNAAAQLSQKSNNMYADCIRNMTRYQLELGGYIAFLKKFKLESPFDEVTGNITDLYKSKIDLFQQMSDTCSQLLAGPRPGVDYSKLAAESPKINARLEYIDETLFKIAPLVFATLIDPRPDKNNHVNHLIITKIDRDVLVKKIVISFGEKLKDEKQGYLISAASVLYTYLAEKGYKCSDEPW